MGPPPLFQALGLGLIAGAMLALEVGFTRAFSITIWYHFAYLIIGVAQLGTGAAGAYLAARPRRPEELREILPRVALAFSATVLLSIAAMTLVAFDPLRFSIAALLRTALGLLVYLGVLLTLFFSAGYYIAGVFTCASERAHRLYFADLGGACVATLLTLKLMLWLQGVGLFFLVALLGLGASFCAGPLRGALRHVAKGVGVVAAVGLALCALGLGPSLPIPPSKELYSFLHKEQAARPALTIWDPVARLDVLPVFRPDVNNVIGALSPAFPPSPPLPRRRVTFDGTSNAQVLGWDGRRESLEFFSHSIVAAPYQVAPSRPKVLCIGVGGGMDLLLARYYGARHITGVELNGALVELLKGPLAEFSHDIARAPDTILVAGEGRSFLERAGDRYDVIQGLGVDNFAALSSGAYVLSESYLYTVDSFLRVYDRLSDDGVFAWTRSVDDPPREMLRLVVLARAALERRGVCHPERHLAIVASASEPYGTLLMSRRPLGGAPLSVLRDWARRNGFPLLLEPDEGPAAADAAARGGAERSAGGTVYERYLRTADPAPFWRGYRYDVSPVDDDRPFFYNYFRWGSLLSGDRAADGDVNLRLPIANVVLLLLLGGALGAGALVALLPLLRQRREGLAVPGAAGTLLYFSMLGLGYIAVQAVLIQGLTLVIGYPTLAITVTIATMLGASGVGSLCAPRLCAGPRGLRLVLLLVVCGILAVATLLRPASAALLPLSEPLRIAGAVLLVAPLAFFMGMPFPTGLRAAALRSPLLVGWAWAVNGVCAVLGSTLTVVVAMGWGFRSALAVAALAYAGALAVAGRLLRGAESSCAEP